MSSRDGSIHSTPVAAGGYREHPAPAVLRPFVECFWTREPGTREEPGAAVVHRVLPDGCIDIVFEFAPVGGAPESIRAVGTMTRPLVVNAVTDDSFVGVRFRPARASAFLRLPADLKSTRLNSNHLVICSAVLCLKKTKK